MRIRTVTMIMLSFIPLVAQAKTPTHRELSASKVRYVKPISVRTMTPLPRRAGPRLGGNVVNWVAWKKLYCDNVDWNMTCNGSVSLEAPVGWQMCKPIWGTVTRGRGSPMFVATKNDAVHTSYWMHVEGSHDMFDRWGSNMDAYDVGAELIQAPTTAAERAAAGCWADGWSKAG